MVIIQSFPTSITTLSNLRHLNFKAYRHPLFMLSFCLDILLCNLAATTLEYRLLFIVLAHRNDIPRINRKEGLEGSVAPSGDK